MLVSAISGRVAPEVAAETGPPARCSSYRQGHRQIQASGPSGQGGEDTLFVESKGTAIKYSNDKEMKVYHN